MRNSTDARACLPRWTRSPSLPRLESTGCECQKTEIPPGRRAFEDKEGGEEKGKKRQQESNKEGVRKAAGGRRGVCGSTLVAASESSSIKHCFSLQLRRYAARYQFGTRDSLVAVNQEAEPTLRRPIGRGPPRSSKVRRVSVRKACAPKPRATGI